MDGAALIPEFDHEFAQTRRSLERAPADRWDWKPHEKSYSLGRLVSHLAELPTWTGATLDVDVFEMDPSWEPFHAPTPEEALAAFDENLARAREALASASAEKLAETWSFKDGDETLMSMPKGAVVRSFILNHNVHHRAQLGVYLRLLDVPVPAIYGPSADEEG
ncbi:MAG: DinB family protein [Gemmatimonadota bacterium]|jgi:uncharacterized damage-inducible protein DinB